MLESIRNFIVPLSRSILAGIGAVWLILEPYYTLSNVASTERLGTWCFFFLGVFVGLVWYAIDGYFVSGFLWSSITLSSNAFNTRVVVRFGDLFQMDGWKVVSVNEFFDSTVDDRHVAASSLHGVMLTRYWAGHTQDFDMQVAESLAGTTPNTTVLRTSPGKTQKYDIGTTATAVKSDHKFLCVVLTRTNIETLEASASLENFHTALRGMLQKARATCSGQPLNIPLLGGGLAKLGIKHNIIVDLILLAVFEETKKQKITSEIRIVLPSQLRHSIDLTTLKMDWT